MATIVSLGEFEVDLEDVLGEGGQINGPGEGVFRGVRTATGQAVAVKRFNFRRAIGQGNHQDVTSKYIRLKREVENAWKVSGHPNIVTLIDVLFDEGKEFLHLVMELGDGQDLFTHISKNGVVREELAQVWTRQLLEGVSWFHGLSVCHRDLKLENVLLTAAGDIKIADFGMSKDYSQSNAHTRTRIGTLAYLAPELLQGGAGAAGAAAAQPYATEPVDIWAVGVTLYVMMCGCYPFGTDQTYDKHRQQWVVSNDNRIACMRRIELGEVDQQPLFRLSVRCSQRELRVDATWCVWCGVVCRVDCAAVGQCVWVGVWVGVRVRVRTCVRGEGGEMSSRLSSPAGCAIRPATC